MISALAENRVIGNKNKLPWHMPADFKWFKEKTGFDFPEFQAKALPKLTEAGLISHNKGGICLTRNGFLFADTVSSEFI